MFNQPNKLLIKLSVFITATLLAAGFTLLGVRPNIAYAQGPCFATINDTTVYSSTDSQAVRDAVAAAVDNDTVKVAGTCTGVDTGVLATIGASITVQGGYTDTNWSASNPTANPTTLDAAQAGQVLYITNGADVTVDGLNLINGNAAGRGGGIQVNFGVGGTVLTVTNSHFENNYAGSFGGAIDNGAQNLVRIQNSTFISNTTGGGGGAIVMNAGAYADTALTITGSEFTENHANGNAGGAVGMWGGDVTIANTNFISNTTVDVGGVLYATGAVAVTGGDFISNTAATGGGIYATTGITVTGSNFISNTATTAQVGGGALVLTGGSSTISGSTFTGNNDTVTAGNVDGGAIHNGASSTLRVDSTTFTRNAAHGAGAEGGAIFNDGTLHISTSTFSHNYGDDGTGWGGGALLNTGSATITNSTFYSNTSGVDGSAIAQRGTLTAINNTFSDNSQPSGGSINAGGTTHLINNIIANTVSGTDCSGTLATNTKNLIEDNTCTPAVSGDPQLGPLQDNGGNTWTMAIPGNSPAINAGDNASCPATDQRGTARSDGSCDIGAYEGVASTTGPGGVTIGLELWLKANEGVTVTGITTVTGWADQSGSGNDASQGNAAYQPALATETLNFNPAIDFETADRFGIADINMQTTDNGAIFAVFQDYSSHLVGLMPSAGDDAEDPQLWTASQFVIFSDTPSQNQSFSHPGAMPGGQPHVGEVAWFNTPAASTVVGLNGYDLTSAIEVHPGKDVGIGFDFLNNSGAGKIGEIVIYNAALTPDSLNKIDSYLAIKYGITLTGTQGISYTDSGDITIWDADTNAAYHHDVAGIGVDNNSVLTQTTSRSVNSDSIVTITGTTANIVDGEFLVWGNDNGSLSGESTNVPGGYNQRLARIWKTQETGETGSTTISFDMVKVTGLDYDLTNPGGFALLVDSDTDLSNAAATTGATVNGSIVTFSGVNLSDGQYFSLAYPQGPAKCYATIDATTVYSTANSLAVRQAIAAANAGQTVKVAGYCAGISGGQLANITKTLTVRGGYTTTNWTTPDFRANRTTLDAVSSGRVIVASADVTLENFLMINGNSSGVGGGIYMTGGSLVLSNTHVMSNTSAGNGGGIYPATGTNIVIENSTLAYNQTTGGNGGGIDTWATATTIRNSTIASNTANSDSGGVGIGAGTVDMVNVTISHNSAAGNGGGIGNGGTLNITNTIVANSLSGGDCFNAGTLAINANNLIEDGTCSPAFSGDPQLGPLQDNSGDTWTMAIPIGSAAYNNANIASCPATDQRGINRPQGGGCDIGAYERVALYLPIIYKKG